MNALPSYTAITHVLVPCPGPVTGKGAVSKNAAKVIGEPSDHAMDLQGVGGWRRCSSDGCCIMTLLHPFPEPSASAQVVVSWLC